MTTAIRTTAVMVCAVALVAAGCVEESTEQPNSNEGYLFVDLEHRLAVDWQSRVLVRGPATGGENCDPVLDCYPNHRKLDMKEVTSSDPDVVEVVDFEPDNYGEADAVRLDLDVVGEGEATLEFRFGIEGVDPGDYDSSDEEDDRTDIPDDGVFVDSFDVAARQVAGTQLRRRLDEVDPLGPYANCPETDAGIYLMDGLDQYTVQLEFIKFDNEGNPLRGSGDFPVQMDPEDAVEVVSVDEPRHRVEIRPRNFGSVEMTPPGSNNPLEAHFVSLGDVSQMDVVLHQLARDGSRAGTNEVMFVNYLYELEARPKLGADLPLCGGAVPTEVDSLTPAICDQQGVVESTGNPAVAAANGGQCRFQVTLHRGSSAPELVENHSFSVQYNY